MERIYLAIVKNNITNEIVSITAHATRESAEHGLHLMKCQHGCEDGEIQPKTIHNFNAK